VPKKNTGVAGFGPSLNIAKPKKRNNEILNKWKTPV